MYSSPLAERFTKITEKLNTVPLNAENSRSHRIDNLENRVRGIEERFNDSLGK